MKTRVPYSRDSGSNPLVAALFQRDNMFVRRSTYDKLMDDYLKLRNRYMDLLRDWNYIIGRINSKGGEAFLDSKVQFTEQEMRQLAILCHPDKHGNSEVSVKLTKKIMELRK